ncbi:MAG: YfhO family protein [Eubacterium sp.]|nr:YfhO family protein [Eubacterium sp.]
MIIKGIEPFGNNTFVNEDCISYIYPYLVILYDKLKNGESLFYYWNGSLGDSYLPNFFYLVSSPVNLLVVFVNKSDIRSFINLSLALRIVISAGAFSFYLVNENKDKNRIFVVPLACAYALSGFVLGYYHESMWLDSYMIFPIIMYGYNKMIRDNNPLVYILSLAYSAYCSIFMTFIIGIFLVLWYVIDSHESFKRFIKDGIRFIFFSLLSAGLTAFPIVITGVAIADSRIGKAETLHHEWFSNIFYILRNQFFLSVPIKTAYKNCANVYCGTFVVVMFFMYLFSSQIKLSQRIKRISILIFLLVSMNESVLNYIWHGFHLQNGVPNRFSFLYIFVLLLMAKDVLDNELDVKKSLIGMLLSEAFVFVSFFYVDFDCFIMSKIAFIVSLIIVFFYSAFVLAINYSKKIILYVILAYAMLFEILSHSFCALNSDKSVGDFYDEVYSSIEHLRGDILKDSKNDLNRTRVMGMASKNNELVMGFNGIGAFNVFQNKQVVDFLNKCGYFTTIVSIDDRGGYLPLDDMLGLKRIVTLNDDFNRYLGYKNIYNDENIHIFENQNAISLGYGINNSESINLTDDDKFENINTLSANMTGIKDVMEKVYPKYNIESEGYELSVADSDKMILYCHPSGSNVNPYIKLSFVTENPGIYNMNIAYTNISKISVAVNDEVRRKEWSVQSSGILSLGMLKAEDRVDVYIENTSASDYNMDPKVFYNLEVDMAILNQENYNQLIEYLKDNQMTVDIRKSDEIYGNISLKKNQMLFTSIPYDKGWHIYEGEKELEKVKYADSFIGLNLSEGNHELIFKYVPSGFYMGLIINAISLIIFIGIIVMKIINKSPNNEKLEGYNGFIYEEDKGGE